MPEDEREPKDYEHFTLSIVMSFGVDSPNCEVWLDEHDLKMCYQYANKDFDRFIELLRFVTSFGSKQ